MWGRFDHDTALYITEIEIFLTLLPAKVKPVGSTLEIRTPGPDKSPVRIENDGRVITPACFVNCVMDMNESILILGYTVDVPIANLIGQSPPIVANFIGVITTAHC
jgi:hypothetical protein